jgi:hypothetical protein
MHDTQDGVSHSQVTDSEQFLDRNYVLGLTPPPECETPPRPFDLRTRAIAKAA